MFAALDSPLAVLAATLVVLSLATCTGAWLRTRRGALTDDTQQQLLTIFGASLTLLGLVLGFAFSMALGRYDQRKHYEEAEANAIGTEYDRAGLLPAADASRVRTLLRDYLGQRVLFYEARDQSDLGPIEAGTSRMQSELWSAVASPAGSLATPAMALAISGMNDVLNSQGYTRAAWWNRIPYEAWVLMTAIAVCCNLLFGFSTRDAKAGAWLLIVLPVVVSIAFAMIADLDSPRGGIIRLVPENLLAVAASLGSK